MAPLIVLAGIERGAPAWGLVLFWAQKSTKDGRAGSAPIQCPTKITIYIALFLAPEKGRKRAPPQGATKITFKREIL